MDAWGTGSARAVRRGGRGLGRAGALRGVRQRLGSGGAPEPHLILEVEVVLAVLAELGGGHVHADLDLAGVAGLLDRLDEELEALVIGLDVGCEAALVTDVARVLAVLLLDDRLEVVVNLAAHLHRLLEGGGAGRADHELLHGESVAGVGAAVDHVHPRDRHHELAGASKVGDVAVEGHALLRGAGLAHGERNREDRVGAELGLVRGAVEVDHLLVNRGLLDRVHARDGRGDEGLDVLNSLEHALAEVARLVAIAAVCVGSSQPRNSSPRTWTPHSAAALRANATATTRGFGAHRSSQAS